MLLEYRPLLAVLVSVLAAGLILLSGNRPNLREVWTFLAAFLKCGLVVSMLPAVLRGEVLEVQPLVLTPGLSLHLRVDSVGILFALVASILWIVTSIYSVGYMRSLKEKHQTGYFAAFAMCLAATMGIAFAANLLTFFVFFEVLTIATYPLVIHKRSSEAIRAGRKYLGYTLIAGQAFLVAVIWANHMVPGGEFRPGGFLSEAFVSGRASWGALCVFFVCFMFVR